MGAGRGKIQRTRAAELVGPVLMRHVTAPPPARAGIGVGFQVDCVRWEQFVRENKLEKIGVLNYYLDSFSFLPSSVVGYPYKKWVLRELVKDALAVGAIRVPAGAVFDDLAVESHPVTVRGFDIDRVTLRVIRNGQVVSEASQDLHLDGDIYGDAKLIFMQGLLSQLQRPLRSLRV